MTNQNRDKTSIDRVRKLTKAEIKPEAENEFYIGQGSQNIPDAKPVRRSEKDKHWYCPYNLCGYKSLRKANVRMHIVTHTGEKPFECDTCSTRFSSKTNLAGHKRLGVRVCQKVLARRERKKRKQTKNVFHIGQQAGKAFMLYDIEAKNTKPLESERPTESFRSSNTNTNWYCAFDRTVVDREIKIEKSLEEAPVSPGMF